MQTVTDGGRVGPVSRIARILGEEIVLSTISSGRQIEQILDRYQPLLSQSAVVSLAVHTKPTPTLLVGVISKPASPPVPPSVTVQISDADGRPTSVELATKIIEEGEIVAHMSNQPVQQAVPQVVRPAKGGWGIRASQYGRGTLGVNIQYNGAYQLLSCAHVLTQYAPGRIGAWIHQPPVIANANQLVQVSWQAPVTYYQNQNQQHPVENIRDIATGVINAQLGDAEIELVGTPAGVRAPNPQTDNDVDLCGAVSGFTSFQIDPQDFAVRYRSSSVDSGGNTIYTWWQSGMRYASFGGANAGDSGAALVSTHDNHVIGLHRAGSPQYGYGCPI